MANKQIHQLPAANALVPEDQLLVSQAGGNVTRRASLANLPFQPPLPGTSRRTIAAKLAETVSIKDFGAVGDGSVDDSPAFQAAVDQHTAIHVPAGTYRLDSEVQVKPRRRLFGAGRDATILDARGVRALTFQRNEGAYRVDSDAGTDWCRSSLSDLRIVMATGGIRVLGHEFRGRHLLFVGGAAAAGIADADGWCIDLIDANECELLGIQAGYGGGGSHVLRANGIRWRSTQPGVNYGDSLLAETSIKLGARDTCGVQLLGNHPGLINNVLLQRIQVNAPAAAGADAVQVPGSSPAIYTLAGTVGVHLKTVRRSQLNTVDVEVVETGFKEEGTGVNGSPGTSADIAYLNCQAQNCVVPYADNNGGEGAVMRRSIVGCTELFPIKTGVGSTDAAVRAGRGATLLPSDLWLTEPNKGFLGVQLRAWAPGVLYVAQDFKHSDDVVADGNPKNRTPRRGLIIDGSANDTTVISAPRGLNTSTVRRLEIGNGAAHPDGRLHRIELRDPLYLTPRQDSPANATLPGMLCYFDSSANLPVNTRWSGPGVYMLAQWQGGFEWMPASTVAGLEPDREENVDVTVGQFHVGRMVRVNHGSNRTVTIGEGVVNASFPLARFWVMRQGSGRVLFQEAGGAVWKSTSGMGVLKEIPRQYQIVEVWLRWNPTLNANAGGTEIYATHGIMPDGEFTYHARFHHTTAAGNQDPATPYVLASAHVGKVLRVNNAATSYVAIDSSFCPPGLEGARFGVMKLNAGNVVVKAGTGITARLPGGATEATIIDQFKATWFLVTAANDSVQPNSLYLES
jgi:hypothetical protein